MNCVCKLKALPCEFGGCHFWQEWDVHKIGGGIKRASLINVKDLIILWIHVNPKPCIWIVVCYLP